MTAVDINEILPISLVLRTEEEHNLLYVVEIEDDDKTYRCYASENYDQALLVARKVFSKLKTKQQQIGDFAVMIESPQGRGISYDVNHFTCDPSFDDAEDFYEDLVNEFEYEQAIRRVDNNTLFREIVGKNKLNEYQEQRFLQYLKELRHEKRGP